MKKKVVIVGGGFGGVSAAKSLANNDDLEIYLIDRRNFHLFQPLLYQVAMAGLNPSDISVPLRSLFRGKKNVHILLAEVSDLDLEQQRIFFDQSWFSYDYLILACGSKHSYFGKNDWEELAPGLKNLEQAIEIRRRILTSFELAEKETDLDRRRQYLTFAVVGGGPTGVEVAGAIAEMASHTLRRDFLQADLSQTKVILIEGGPRVLASFPPELSQKAEENLRQMGVEVLTNARATELNKEGIRRGDHFIPCHTIVWAAGVLPSSLTQKIPTEKDKSGRAIVKQDLSLPGFPHTFVIGDQACFADARLGTLPGLAPVATQQGAFLAKVLASDLKMQPRPHFEYFDKGIMATIGRSKAVVSAGSFQFSGRLAWLTWVFVHILYLMNFRSKFFVFLQWAWSYLTFSRGARLITHKTWRFYSGEKIKLD